MTRERARSAEISALRAFFRLGLTNLSALWYTVAEMQKHEGGERSGRFRRIVLPVLFLLCIAAVVIFSLPDLLPIADEQTERLLQDTVPRFSVALFLTVFMCFSGYQNYLTPPRRGLLRALLWCIPCFLVAAANFPFSALIRGAAVIERTDLLWLFLLKCLSIAWMEEIFFRALLVPVCMERFQGKRAPLFSVLFSSALFALMHLLNLFFGANVGSVMLQVGYTFLIGCMLAVTLLKTRNVWLCVLIHFLFDIGGMIVTDLGSGYFQDLVFWVLTAVIGVLCAIHIIYYLFFSKKEIGNDL